MKRDKAKVLAPILQAYGDGLDIQVRRIGSADKWDTYDGDCVNFDNANGEWRIKPSPQLRPWKPEEVPFNAIFRHTQSGRYYRIAFLDTNTGDITFCNYEQQKKNIRDIDYYDHSIDNGKTWHPCGVLE